jgi:hypothetical protein
LRRCLKKDCAGAAGHRGRADPARGRARGR